MTEPRHWPVDRLLHEIVALLRLTPDEVEVGHDAGDVVCVDSGLRRTLHLARDEHLAGHFGWTVFAEDEALRAPLAPLGGIRVEIWRPDTARARYRYPLPADPAGFDERTARDLTEFAPPALAFVRDRADLGRLLLAEGEVRRGPVWARFPPLEAPARLAQAVLLARAGAGVKGDIEVDVELAALALAALASQGERDMSWTQGFPYPFRRAVADWAGKAAPLVDVDLTDLTT